MEIREAIIHALDGDAILFIGSGFSLGATNEKNDKFETATPLAHKLLKECEFEEKDFTNDLGIASRIYQDTKGEIDLVEFLRKEYTAIDVTSEQEIIAKINWQRIYTTNYDNVFELACEKQKREYNLLYYLIDQMIIKINQIFVYTLMGISNVLPKKNLIMSLS